MSIDLEFYAFYYKTPKEESMILLRRNLDEINNYLFEIAKQFNLENLLPSIETIKKEINIKGYFKETVSNNFEIYVQKSNIKFDIKSDSSPFKITGQIKKN